MILKNYNLILKYNNMFSIEFHDGISLPLAIL